MIILACSPLAKGAVTGKYSLENIKELTDLRKMTQYFIQKTLPE